MIGGEILATLLNRCFFVSRAKAPPQMGPMKEHDDVLLDER